LWPKVAGGVEAVVAAEEAEAAVVEVAVVGAAAPLAVVAAETVAVVVAVEVVAAVVVAAPGEVVVAGECKRCQQVFWSLRCTIFYFCCFSFRIGVMEMGTSLVDITKKVNYHSPSVR
jgi:hypothetical protein